MKWVLFNGMLGLSLSETQYPLSTRIYSTVLLLNSNNLNSHIIPTEDLSFIEDHEDIPMFVARFLIKG